MILRKTSLRCWILCLFLIGCQSNQTPDDEYATVYFTQPAKTSTPTAIVAEPTATSTTPPATLATPTATLEALPSPIANDFSVENIIAVSVNYQYSLGLLADGSVWGWGWGDRVFGILGGEEERQTYVPVAIWVEGKAIRIEAGATHALVLDSSGDIWSWGLNRKGQLGDGSTEDRILPVQVEALHNVVDMSAGNEFSIALLQDGTVWVWGDNRSGQLGSDVDYSPGPVRLQPLQDIVDVEAGAGHGLALRADGTVWAWGYGWHGQLGQGSTHESPEPVQVLNLSNVIEISANGFSSMALTENGTVWTWGSNQYGQIGNKSAGPAADQLTPYEVPNLHSVVSIASGGTHSLAVMEDGTVWGWGDNTSCQLAIDDNQVYEVVEPTQILGLESIQFIAADIHNIAVDADGHLWGWGLNEAGQLGKKGSSEICEPILIDFES
jgi:alpha-tubulin suppressor-like RCC1 family protein